MNKITLFFIILFMVCTVYFYTHTADGKRYNDKSVKTLSIYKTIYNISNIFKWTRFDGYIIIHDKNKKIVKRYYYKNGRLNGTRKFNDSESEINSCIPRLLKNQ
jgi:hypothetical protein